MKKPVTIISIICVLIIAAVILVLTGVIDLGIFKGKTQESQVEPVASVSYMNTYVLVDKTGVVTSTSMDKPREVPQISGISLKTMITGEAVETSDPRAFSYAMNIVKELSKNGIEGIGEIFISTDNEATLYLEDADVKILLGKENKTSEKFEALVNFYDKLKELQGTLDLQEVSDGYTFKRSDLEAESSSDTYNSEDGQYDDSDEKYADEEYIDYEDDDGDLGSDEE